MASGAVALWLAKSAVVGTWNGTGSCQRRSVSGADGTQVAEDLLGLLRVLLVGNAWRGSGGAAVPLCWLLWPVGIALLGEGLEPSAGVDLAGFAADEGKGARQVMRIISVDLVPAVESET
jgi:hypothetical protein